jgi:hypothetical protein
LIAIILALIWDWGGNMDFWTAVVAIVAISSLSGVSATFFKHRSEKPVQDDSRLEALEQRIEQLERIVTDKRSKLRDDIDSL